MCVCVCVCVFVWFHLSHSICCAYFFPLILFQIPFIHVKIEWLDDWMDGWMDGWCQPNGTEYSNEEWMNEKILCSIENGSFYILHTHNSCLFVSFVQSWIIYSTHEFSFYFFFIFMPFCCCCCCWFQCSCFPLSLSLSLCLWSRLDR